MTLLFLSNLLRTKGLWIAGDVLRAMEARGTAARLLCAGEWFSFSERRAFEAEFRSELHRGSLRLLGLVAADKKADLLANSHFLLLPTRYPLEGQPLVLIEAMSCGLVPITTDQGAITDLFKFQYGDVLASSDHTDSNAVANLVQRLTEDPALYETVSRACTNHYQTSLTFDKCATEILRVLGQVTTVAGPSGCYHTP